MQQPRLIVIQGAPAVGKSTLAKRIAEKFDVFCVEKDDVKEMLFDKFRSLNASQHQAVGAAALESVYVIARELLQSGESIIIEAPFRYEIASKKIRDIIREADVTALQIYCYADKDTQQKRYIERLSSGQRHPGHGDDIGHTINFAKHQEENRPLNLSCETIEIDLTNPNDEDYEVLFSNIKQFMEG